MAAGKKPAKRTLKREDPTKTAAYKRGYREGMKAGKTGKRTLGEGGAVYQSGKAAGKRTGVAGRRAAGGDGYNWRKKRGK